MMKVAKNVCCYVGIPTVVTVVVMVCIFVPVYHFMVNTQYTVVIDSVSGLDRKTGLSFNLTLGVASRSHGAKTCVKPGMYVQVFYRGVQVAASEPETRNFCAGPRKTAELPVVARAAGVPLFDVKLNVLEILEEDIRQGVVPVFYVRLNVPERLYGGNYAMGPWLTDCQGTRVGDAAVLCPSPNQSW
ncbi:unnamed protein product [Alopecurus aequalis]